MVGTSRSDGPDEVRLDRPLLEAALNLSRSHREHEKFYSAQPLESAATVLRASKSFKALADRWAHVQVSDKPGQVPYSGCEDLNDQTAIELSGILFMEGAGEPAEITQTKDGLRSQAKVALETGVWLAEAMATSWDFAAALTPVVGLSDLLGERHRIISNNWLAAEMSQLVGRLLLRAVEILEAIAFSPSALRKDLSGERSTPSYLYSVAEMLDRAADLSVTSSTLTRDNERAWRLFHARVASLLADATEPAT